MKIEDFENVLEVKMEPGDEIQTYGGEMNHNDLGEEPCGEHVDYGIAFDGKDESINFYGMNIPQYMNLGLEIINHLMTNGHQFEIKDNRDGNGEYLTIKH